MPTFNYVTSAHTGILSAAPVKWCLLSWWQYVSLALHILWLPCCLPLLAPPSPSLPPSLPTHSLILSFPSHARKSIAETNVKWLQKRKLLAAALQLCTRADEICCLGRGKKVSGICVGGGGTTAECVSAKITSISLLRGDCRKGPTYLCSEECLSVSDRQEQWRCKRVDNDAFSILQLQNQRQAARGAATRRQTPLTPIISRPPHLSLPSPPNWLEKTNIHGLFFSLAFSRNLPFWQKETETAEWNFLTDEHTVVCVCVWESACIPVFCMRKCFFSHLSRASLCWDINLAMWFITASTHQHVSSEEHHGCLKEPANMQRSHYTRFYTH